MKPLTLYDDGYYEQLSRGDRSDFEDEYRSHWHDIDADRAKANLDSRFRDVAYPEHQLFKAVVDGFSPNNGGGSYGMTFQSTIVNPLCFAVETPADILLAKKTYDDVHLCFVYCEIGDEQYTSWANRVNETITALEDKSNREILKFQLECDGLEIESVQHVTLARAADLFEFNFDTLQAIAQTDSYCIWSHDEDSDERALRLYDGRISHKELREMFNSPVDYATSDFTNIKYRLTGHPLFALQEAMLQTLVERLNDRSDENPREFNGLDFIKHFRSGLGVGPVCDEREEVIQRRAGELLELAEDTDMVFTDEDDITTERDYRFRTQQRFPEGVKETVKSKFLTNRAEYERGRLAYKRTRDGFDPKNSDLGDFF